MTSPLSHCAVHTMQRVSKTYCSLTGLPYQTNQPASQPGGAPRRCSHNKTTEYVGNSQSRWVAESRVSSESRERESNTSSSNNIRVRIRSWLSAGATHSSDWQGVQQTEAETETESESGQMCECRECGEFRFVWMGQYENSKWTARCSVALVVATAEST